jgi:DNA-binding phage protein
LWIFWNEPRSSCIRSSSARLLVEACVHSIATESRGNLYTTETYEGRRLQQLEFRGATEENGFMALTRDFKQTVVERAQRDPAFAQALLDEAATLFLNGDPEAARLILRDLVNATIGFEQLAALTDKPSKSLHRMLSPAGNPSMDNLASIFQVMRECLNVNLQAKSVAA